MNGAQRMEPAYSNREFFWTKDFCLILQQGTKSVIIKHLFLLNVTNRWTQLLFKQENDSLKFVVTV